MIYPPRSIPHTVSVVSLIIQARRWPVHTDLRYSVIVPVAGDISVTSYPECVLVVSRTAQTVSGCVQQLCSVVPDYPDLGLILISSYR
jgi:hypothetical protein